MKRLILGALFCCFIYGVFASCSEEIRPVKKDETPDKSETVPRTTEFTLLQLNIWVECTKVPDATESLVDQIEAIKPDVATFCELFKGDGDGPIIPYLIAELQKRGLRYYAVRESGRAIISKFEIVETVKINSWMFKAVLNIAGNRIVVYPAHSEYRYYSCYYPRGYNDGSTNWDKLPEPITDVETILKVNRGSDRVASAQDFVNSARREIASGALVFLGGDLNEPSHLDWQQSTKDMRDHRGCVVNWDQSLMLYNNGFKDAYRVKYPDPVLYPGFTFPADNKDVHVKDLTWAPDADERERIDFVYYYPVEGLSVESAKLVGPKGSIVRSERVEESTKDTFIAPAKNRWPSDHKGVLITFKINNKL